MNRGAIAEIERLDPTLVLVKGDLTAEGTDGSTRRSSTSYVPAFGDRLHHVRGNHDATMATRSRRDAPLAGRRCPASRSRCSTPSIAGAEQRPVTPSSSSGSTSSRPRADRPVLVFGHHHPWNPSRASAASGYFGINPDDSERARRRRRPPRRRSSATSPATRIATACGGSRRPARAVGRGRVREGLPGRVGRVPRLRGRHPPDAPPHLDARSARVDRADPRHVRRPLPELRVRRASPTAAS